MSNSFWNSSPTIYLRDGRFWIDREHLAPKVPSGWKCFRSRDGKLAPKVWELGPRPKVQVRTEDGGWRTLYLAPEENIERAKAILYPEPADTYVPPPDPEQEKEEERMRLLLLSGG